jgi:hypothetical protein
MTISAKGCCVFIFLLGFTLGLTPNGRAQQSFPEQDISGKGAVLCSWLIWIDLRNEIDLCYPTEFRQVRANLSEAIDVANDFIVANSPTPVKKAELEAFIEKRLAKTRADLAAGKQTVIDCKNKNTRTHWLEPMSKQSHEDFRRQVDDFLSVRRKPLMNPCL